LQKACFKIVKAGSSLLRVLGVRGRHVTVLDITKSDRRAHELDMNCDEYQKALQGSRYLFAKGWLFRDMANFAKHADTIREVFAPAPEYAQRVAALMERARRDCDLLVGVHIRQGDYQRWEQGRYFYRSEQYAEVMRRYRDAQGERRVRFLVCSNAQQDPALFEGLDVIFGNDHPVEDLYSFAACDRLLGPPSTYTWWASFYGAVPLFVVRALDEPILEEGFQVVFG